MFRGINLVNIDSKGRLAIPTRYRDDLQEMCSAKLILTIDTQASCLLLYPLPEWEQIEKKLQALPTFNAAARRIQRLLIGHASELEMDDNGRILLPALLRDHAKLSNKTMLVGQGKKFEIWAEDLWEMGRDKWLAEEAMNIETLPPEMLSLAL